MCVIPCWEYWDPSCTLCFLIWEPENHQEPFYASFIERITAAECSCGAAFTWRCLSWRKNQPGWETIPVHIVCSKFDDSRAISDLQYLPELPSQTPLASKIHLPPRSLHYCMTNISSTVYISWYWAWLRFCTISEKSVYPSVSLSCSVKSCNIFINHSRQFIFIINSVRCYSAYLSSVWELVVINNPRRNTDAVTMGIGLACQFA